MSINIRLKINKNKQKDLNMNIFIDQTNYIIFKCKYTNCVIYYIKCSSDRYMYIYRTEKK